MGLVPCTSLKMVRDPATLLFCGLLCLLYIDVAFSCTCLHPTRHQSYCESDAVFTGTVVKAKVKDRKDVHSTVNLYEIKINTVYKVMSPARLEAEPNGKLLVKVQSPAGIHGEALCGMQLDKGETYLIEAYYDYSGKYADLMVSSCSNTAPVDTLTPEDWDLYNSRITCPAPPAGTTPWYTLVTHPNMDYTTPR